MYQLVDQFELQARLLLKQNLPENTRHALLLSLSTPFLSFSRCVLPLPPLMDSSQLN